MVEGQRGNKEEDVEEDVKEDVEEDVEEEGLQLNLVRS
jgi:hypothetical protein